MYPHELMQLRDPSPNLRHLWTEPPAGTPDIYILNREGHPPFSARTLAQIIAYLHYQPLCVYSIELVRGDLRSLVVSFHEARTAKQWLEGSMIEVKTDPTTGELIPIPTSNVVPIKFIEKRKKT
jgi:hypothetical protein